MNREIRKYLIEQARKGDRGITFYGDVAKKLGLDTMLPDHRSELSRVLGEIATYEYKHSRPLLSSVVTYDRNSTRAQEEKVWKDPIHGPGLYNIAEELLDISANKLQQELWGVKEMNRSREFWQEDANYHRFLKAEN